MLKTLLETYLIVAGGLLPVMIFVWFGMLYRLGHAHVENAILLRHIYRVRISRDPTTGRFKSLRG